MRRKWSLRASVETAGWQAVTSPAPSPVAAFLAEVKEGAERFRTAPRLTNARDYAAICSARDVPPLLAALEAVLALTEPPTEPLLYDLDGPLGLEVSKVAVREAIEAALRGAQRGQS